jgi:phosphatidylglycerol:prolipoprotein diacylglycerol transferase
MSFHGGLCGVIIATYWFCYKRNISFLRVMDLCACAAPIGLFLGRVANFINGELYGRVTDAYVGMVFPMGGPLPRHPSQLYEAVLEGLVLLVVLFVASQRGARHFKGLLSGMFLCGYALARMVSEYFREPDMHLGFIVGDHITMGQILSIPMLLLGVYIIVYARKQKRDT